MQIMQKTLNQQNRRKDMKKSIVPGCTGQLGRAVNQAAQSMSL